MFGEGRGPGGIYARSALMISVFSFIPVFTGGIYMIMSSLPAAIMAYGLSKLVPKTDCGYTARTAAAAIFMTFSTFLPFIVRYFAADALKLEAATSEGGSHSDANNLRNRLLLSGFMGMGSSSSGNESIWMGVLISAIAPLCVAVPPACLLYYTVRPTKIRGME